MLKETTVSEQEGIVLKIYFQKIMHGRILILFH